MWKYDERIKIINISIISGFFLYNVHFPLFNKVVNLNGFEIFQDAGEREH